MERTPGKAVAGDQAGKMAASRPSEVADCGTEQARLQLVSKAAAGRPGQAAAGGVGSPTFTCG